MSKYYIGIDGGGTKTEFIMADVEGNIVAKHKEEKSHYLTIGFDGLEKVIHDGVATCIKQVGCTSDDIEFCAVCICGYEDVKEHDYLIEQAVQKALGCISHKVYSDTVNAHRGSLIGQPGIHVIAGTGSIAFGMDRNGNSIRCGGWNHLFGGDEGSAYWIACKMLLAFTRQSDGRDPKTYLYDYLKTKYQLLDDGKIIDLTVVEYQFDRTKIANMAKDLYEIAKAKDSVAISIFKEVADELTQMILAIGDQLKLNEAVQVSFSGGVFNCGKFVLTPLRNNLKKKNYVLVKPKFTPGIGAIIVAYVETNVPITEQIMNHLA